LPVLFMLVIFKIGSCFMPRLYWNVIFLFVLPWVASLTSKNCHTQALVEMGVSQFCWGWPWTMILLISTFWVARISVSHHAQQINFLLEFELKALHLLDSHYTAWIMCAALDSFLIMSRDNSVYLVLYTDTCFVYTYFMYVL
jgi:hypothetical protein